MAYRHLRWSRLSKLPNPEGGQVNCLKMFPLFALLMMGGLALADAPATQPTQPAVSETTRPALAPGERAVILISVDGLAHYYFDDSAAPMPAMRALAFQGVHAAGGMRAVMPTVTWPNHTTLVTGVGPGKHGVIANNYLDRATRKPVTLITDPVYEKEELVKVPTIYDVAHEAGMTTAAVCWPASRGAKNLDWTVPDSSSETLFLGSGSPALLSACREAGIPVENQEKWASSGDYASRDRMYTDMFKLILHRFAPRLSLLHLINVDHIEHLHGPQTPQAYEAVKMADAMVAEVIEAARKSYGDRVTFVIVSDHGFFPYRQLVLPNVLLHKAGLLEEKNGRILSAKVQSLAQGGAALVYLLDTRDRDALLKQVTNVFSNAEGIERIIGPGDYAQFGLANPTEDPRMADLILSAKKGYAFSDVAAGEMAATAKTSDTRGTHGYDANQTGMYATFIAAGADIVHGATLDRIDNLRVAPTIARLLGLHLKSSDAEPLAIFQDDQKSEAPPSGTSATAPSLPR